MCWNKDRNIPSAEEDDEPACSLAGQKLKNSEQCFVLNELNLHSNLHFKYSQVFNHQWNHWFYLLDVAETGDIIEAAALR